MLHTTLESLIREHMELAQGLQDFLRTVRDWETGYDRAKVARDEATREADRLQCENNELRAQIDALRLDNQLLRDDFVITQELTDSEASSAHQESPADPHPSPCS